VKRKYEAPVFEKITFDYKIQTASSVSCYESVMNEKPEGESNACTSGSPISIGWTKEQTYV